MLSWMSLESNLLYPNFLLFVCHFRKNEGGGNNLMIAEVICLPLSRVSDIKLLFVKIAESN